MNTTEQTRSTVRAYHDAWTGGDFDTAVALLSPALAVEVPVNAYPTRESFAEALRGFGSLATRVELLSETVADGEAMLLYDMDVDGLGPLRVAEHFTIGDGHITRLRQIHDTAALREAGFVAPAYTCRVSYRAPIEAVFDAAARPGGADGWWSTRGDVARHAGQLLRLNWSGDDHIVFRIDELDRPRSMRWTCVEQVDGNLDPSDEWVGTTLSFRFTDEGDTTRLDFVHEGLVPQLACYEVCEHGWDVFLRRSLRSLVEAGRGLPYDPA